MAAAYGAFDADFHIIATAGISFSDHKIQFPQLKPGTEVLVTGPNGKQMCLYVDNFTDEGNYITLFDAIKFGLTIEGVPSENIEKLKIQLRVEPIIK